MCRSRCIRPPITLRTVCPPPLPSTHKPLLSFGLVLPPTRLCLLLYLFSLILPFLSSLFEPISCRVINNWRTHVAIVSLQFSLVSAMFRGSFTILSLLIIQCQSKWIKALNLPRQLLKYHVSSNTHLREKCINDPGCKINVRFWILLLDVRIKFVISVEHDKVFRFWRRLPERKFVELKKQIHKLWREFESVRTTKFYNL